MLKNLTLRVLCSLFFFTMSSMAIAAEEWKGQPYNEKFSVSGMTGVGILDGRAGLGLNGLVSLEILHQGFFPDTNNQVYLEAMAGGLFIDNSTGFDYSLHLRWDFHKNETWSLYSIGGFGGYFTGASLGNRSEFYPRFGIGAMWHLFEKFSFRGEISHEFTGIGIHVKF